MALISKDSSGFRVLGAAKPWVVFVLCCSAAYFFLAPAISHIPGEVTQHFDVFAASPPQAPADFANLVTQLTADAGGDSPALKDAEAQALAILDRAALTVLNGPAPTLDDLNRRMAQFVTREPALGQSYRAVQFPGTPTAYALVANFGPGGPSAVRVYAGAAGKVVLVGRVDRYLLPDFLDNYIELIPWNSPNPSGLFLTISGRTDELQSGVFAAWRFDGRLVVPVWISDILEQTSYSLDADGFHLTYCGEGDPNDPTKCLQTQRERYSWLNGRWTQLESTTLPAAP